MTQPARNALGAVDGLTHDAIATRLGVTRQAIYQRERAALAKMRLFVFMFEREFPLLREAYGPGLAADVARDSIERRTRTRHALHRMKEKRA